MIVAHYIGPAKPGIAARIGWAAIRLGQKGPYDDCTHTEAVHQVHADGTFTIASSSIADRGVRVKRTTLTPGHWVLTDVPAWDVARSVAWFAQAQAAGVRYDRRGALATLLPGKQDGDKVYCTEAVLSPYVLAAHYYTPALGLALCLSLGIDVTDALLRAE